MLRLLILFVVSIFNVSAFSTSPPPGLDTLQDRLEKSLVSELVKKAPGKITLDLNHSASLVATANVTTKTESHAVMTTGSPEDTPVVRMISEAVASRSLLDAELETLTKRRDFVSQKCGAIIQGAAEYVKSLKRKGDIVPDNIDQNPYPHSPSSNAAATVIIEGLSRCPNNSCVHTMYDGGDDVVSLLQLTSSVPSTKMESHIEKILRDLGEKAETLEGYEEFKRSVLRAEKAGSDLDSVAIKAETLLESKFAEASNALDVLQDPSPDSIRIAGGKEHVLKASFGNSVSFRDSLMRRCAASVQQIDSSIKEVQDELESISQLGVQLAQSLESLSEVTWGADSMSHERREIDANLVGLIQAARMRDAASKHVEEAKVLAESFRRAAESTEESEYKSAQEIEGVRRQIYLLQAAADTAEKFAHVRMSEAVRALRCVVEGKSGDAKSIDANAEASDLISQMTAHVRSAIDEARLRMEDEEQESEATSEDRDRAVERAHEVEMSASNLLSSISSFLEVEEEKCVETYSASSANQKKFLADTAAREAANYVKAMELTVDKLHNVQHVAMNIHHRNVAAHKRWRDELNAVSVREKSVAASTVLVQSFEKKLTGLRSKVSSSSSEKNDLTKTRDLAHELVLKLLGAPSDIVEFETSEPSVSFLEISEVGERVLDDIKAASKRRQEAQLERWKDAIDSRSTLLTAARDATQAVGRMKIARLKLLQKQLDFELARSSASDEAGKMTSVPSEFAASSAASAAAFLRARDLREKLDRLSEVDSSASVKSKTALQGDVDDSPVPDGVRSLWKESESSIRDAVRGIVNASSDSFLDKGSYADALTRLHSTTNEELRMAVKGQLKMENSIDALQEGFGDVRSEDKKIASRVNATEAQVLNIRSQVETRLSEIRREVAKWETDLSDQVSRWKAMVRDRMGSLARNVTELEKLGAAARKMRDGHKKQINDHKNRLASVDAQIAHLNALVEGVDVEKLAIDSSAQDVKKMTNASKSNEKFLENKGLAPLRNQISEINAETEELNKALQMGSTSASFLQISSRLRGSYESEFEDIMSSTGGATGGSEEEEKSFDMETVMNMLKDHTDEIENLGFAESGHLASRMHETSNEFHAHVLELQHRAAAMKAEAESLDHEYDVAKRRSEDSVHYAQDMKALLREKMDRVGAYQRAVTMADLDDEESMKQIEDNLLRATKEKDETFAKTQNAVAQAEKDEKRVVEIHDERFATWRAADALAQDAKKAAQLAIELQVKAAKSLVTYANSLVRHEKVEVESEEASVHEIGRETYPLIGSLATVPIGELGFGATASAEDELEDSKNLPAPLGRWEARGPISIDSTYDPLPISPSGPAPSDFEVDHVVQNVVTLLKASEKRSTAFRGAMFEKSNEVHKLGNVRSELVATVSETPTEQQKDDLARSAIEEARAMKDFETLSSSYESNLKIVKALRALLNRKVHLHSEIEHLEKVRKSADDAVEMLHGVQMKASELVVSSANAALKEKKERDTAEAAAKQKAYESKLLESVFGSSDDLDSLVSLLELDESQEIVLRALSKLQEGEEGDDDMEDDDVSSATGSATGASEDIVMSEDIKKLMKGEIDDVVIPDWHSISPEVAARIAEGTLDHARHFEKQTLDAARDAARASEQSKEKHEDAVRQYDDAQDRYESAETKAQLSESQLGGSPTGLAFDSLGLESGASPTGSALDELNDRIGQYRDIVRQYRDDAKQDRQEARDAFKAQQSAKESHDASLESSLESNAEHKQSVAVHQRLSFWADASSVNDKDAQKWLKMNEKAENERKLQEEINQRASLLDS